MCVHGVHVVCVWCECVLGVCGVSLVCVCVWLCVC